MVVTILGISAGTRTIGIAVLRGDDLIEWQVKTFKAQWSKEKLKSILQTVDGLIEYFKVDALALKETSPVRSSANLKKVIQSMIELARKKRIKYSRYSLDDLKQQSSSNWKNTKDDLMEFIAEKYPILRKEYLKERNNVRPYYLRMFEAIGAARILIRDIEHV